MAKRETSSLPVNYAEQLANEVSNIQARISAPSGDRIRMNGSAGFVLPDGTEAETIDGVIVDFVSSNLLFEGAFDAKNPQPPGCFAVGPEPTTLIPSNNSPNKQAETCAVCSNNQFGSNGKGKACKNTRLLAIKALDSDDIAILSVPPTSIKAFDSYVSTLASKHRLPPVGVLTRISLDRSVTYAAPRFDVVKPLGEDELPAVMEARKPARERLVVEPDFSQYVPPAPARGAPARGPIGRR
jgi:hypothetical protein